MRILRKLFERLWENFIILLNTPEMKIFWIFVPFLVTIFVVNSFFLPRFFIIMTGGLVVIIGVIVFFYAGSLAKSNKDIKLERSEQGSIISSLDDAVVAYDRDFKILFFNPSAEALFRQNSAAVLGKIITPKDAENRELRFLTQVIFPSLAPVMVNRSEAGGYPQTVDLSFKEPMRELRVITNPIVGERQEVVGFLKIIRDRTRDVSILRSKNEFITIASHQLRGPITNINWALQALASNAALEGEARELIASASAAGYELLDIVDDLLMVAKIEEGRFGYNFESINIIEFIDDMLAEIIPRSKDIGIKLYFDRPSEPLKPVIADREKLNMVLENILDNAMRYNVAHGEITIKVDPIHDKPFVEVRVKDSGIGIPPEELEKIFTKFFRADNALKFKTEGSGLGLYIAKNIVRAMGGDMRVESELNRGSTFVFTLSTDQAVIPAKEMPVEY